ncbi:MAG: hypothetical protein Q8936_16730 [Bacillota bacterium]|nr:hypothetical protein [Bacillota bacterium]
MVVITPNPKNSNIDVFLDNICQYMPDTKKLAGLSSATKPTTVSAGSTFYETDTKNRYIFDGVSWYLEQTLTTVPAYSAKTTITRGSTVTTYSAGQIILGNGASSLPSIDISAATGLNLANRKIAITGAFLVSNNGANTPFNGYVDIFNVNNPAVDTALADYSVFNPNVNTLGTNFVATLDGMNTSRKYGTTSNITMQTEVLRKCQLDSNGKLYFALINSSAYTPINGETLTLILKFYLLN